MPPEEMMMDPEMATAMATGFATAYLVFMAIIYVYFSLCFQIIAKKTATPNAWMAWIPVVNIFLILMIAKKPLWWFILMLIPIVNIVIMIITMMEVAKARGKPGWVGVLMIVPFVNFIVPGYLAFSK